MKTTTNRRYFLLAVFLLGLSLAVVAGCASVARLSTEVARGAGAINDEEADSMLRGIDAVEKTFQDITPEQEYYIGRAVAASLFDSYKPLDNPEANHYLNTLGQTLAMASDRPETFGGYHFQLLDSDEINAFAAPGGLILITRGMFELCETEDALAAVLAHEIGHVAERHGLRAIKNSRLTSALTILAAEGARHLGSEELKQVVEDFESSITDVTNTLVTSGYSRGLEGEADLAAIRIMHTVGYNPTALVDMLREMKGQLKPGGLDCAKTHPDPQDRIDEIVPAISGAQPVNEPAVRHARFQSVVDGLS
jgi:beta-barrel assembly-enhancing protease